MPTLSSDSGEYDIKSPLIPAKKSDGCEEKIGMDEMLQKYSGEFGFWQLRHFVLTSLAWALEAFHTMVMIFADRDPGWRCLDMDSGCSSLTSLTRTICDLEPRSWEWVGSPGSSTVSEWGLVCGEKYKVGLAQSAFFAGNIVGAGIFGHLSDSFLGRKGSLTVICIMNVVFGCSTALSPSYWVYTLLRFLTGLSTGGLGLCAFVLATEPIGPTKRGAAGISTFYFFSIGIAILSGVANIFRSWRALYVAASIPSIFFVIAVIPFISESPRWYLTRGKINHAMRVMHTITKANGKHLPKGILLAIDEDNNKKINSDEQEPMMKEVVTAGSLVDVVRSPITRVRLVLTLSINFLCSVVYYGLNLNVANLETNLYLNVLLNALVEIPALPIAAVLLDKLGRKPLVIGTLGFSGAICLVGGLVGNNGAWKVVRMVCGMLGIFSIGGTYNLLYVYMAELFPTVVRNAALGCAIQAGHMGAILAPMVVVLGGGFPFVVFGACGIVGGTLAFYLPETLNRPLYDTFAGMEEGESARKVLF